MMMYHFGLHKYILGEQVDPPNAADLLAKQKLSYFSDVQWALAQGKHKANFSRISPSRLRWKKGWGSDIPLVEREGVTNSSRPLSRISSSHPKRG